MFFLPQPLPPHPLDLDDIGVDAVVPLPVVLVDVGARKDNEQAHVNATDQQAHTNAVDQGAPAQFEVEEE